MEDLVIYLKTQLAATQHQLAATQQQLLTCQTSLVDLNIRLYQQQQQPAQQKKKINTIDYIIEIII